MVAQKEWIAVRELIGEDGTANVVVEPGAPEKVADQEWRCITIVDGPSESVRRVHGIDAFQSLGLALDLLRTTLVEIPKR